MRKREKLLEHFKSLLILVLMVMLVCSCVIYMLSYQNTGNYAFTKSDMQTLGGESVKYQYADHLSASYIAPKFIGASAKTFGEDIGFYTLGGANEEVHRSVIPFYEKLLSSQATMEKLSRFEGATLFESAVSGDHLYIAYENDLPRSVIYMMASEDAMAPSPSGEYIREIVIAPLRFVREGISSVPEGTRIYTDIYTFYAIARDSLGNYYRYTTDYVPEEEEDICFNTNFYLSYTELGSHFAYDRADSLAEDAFFFYYNYTDVVSEDTVIVKDARPFSMTSLSVLPVSPKPSRVNALLAALFLNPEKVTTYTDDAGVRFYYDEGETVSITPEGVFSYSALGDAGLSLSELFEYQTASESYDVRDYVGASLLLVRGLETAAETKNPVDIFLSDIQFDGTRLTVTFGYAKNGVPMYIGGYPVFLSLEYEAGRLTGASYSLLQIKETARKREEADMLWVLRRQALEGSLHKFYTFGYCPGEGGIYEVTLVGKE